MSHNYFSSKLEVESTANERHFDVKQVSAQTLSNFLADLETKPVRIVPERII